MLRKLSLILKTTAARLSALYLLLFSVCAVILVVYMTSLSVRMLTAQTVDTIDEELQDLSRAYQRGGLPLLVRVIEQRSRQPGANLYLIADPDGRILSGNVESLEPGVLANEGWTDRPFTYRRYGEGAADNGANPVEPANATTVDATHAAIAVVSRLPNQMIVLVGRDLGEPERFRRVVRNALMAAFGMMGLGALAIWFFVGRRALKRIDDVSEASLRIMGGDLSGRLPVTGAGDEFDRLSENLNVMLARIADLNEGLKQVSDNIAHDLKTPLTRLRNRAEATLNGAAQPAEYRAALEGTIAESDQLIRTFNAILMISRLEAGYSAETVVAVDLADAVRDVVELYEPAADELGVKLEADVSRRLCGDRQPRADRAGAVQHRRQRHQIFGQGSGGSARRRRACRSRCREMPARSRCRSPTTAPAFPTRADRQRATERFVRLEQSRSQPGSGLGLSLAKAVMKFHGGRLELAAADPGLIVSMVFPEKAEP